MLKSILIGIDGSAFGTAAIEAGVRWAQHSDAVVVGLAFVDDPATCGLEGVPSDGAAAQVSRQEARLADARCKAERGLQTLARRCADASISCGLHEISGAPVDCLLLEAQRYDLIVLGQRTYFHSEARRDAYELLGSVVARSPRPVIAVPETPREGTSVVVAYDGSLQAARALQAFRSVGLDGGLDIQVVCVHPNQAEAALRAERAVEYLRFHDMAAHSHSIATSEPPDRAILELVKSLDAGLLVMGACGRALSSDFRFGAVTRSMLDTSSVPVFLCQ